MLYVGEGSRQAYALAHFGPTPLGYCDQPYTLNLGETLGEQAFPHT